MKNGAMAITYVVPRYLPSLGGIEIHVGEIARRMVDSGHEVVVATQQRDSSESRSEYIDGVQVIRFPGAMSFRGQTSVAPGLWSYVKHVAAASTITHVHNYHAFATLPALVLAGRPLVFTPHYLGAGRSRRDKALHVAYRRLARRGVGRADVTIHVSSAEREEFERDLTVSKGRSVVIPNGVDLTLLAGTVGKEVQGDLVLVACRLERYKQVHRAVEAMIHLPRHVQLAVAGEGPERLSLQRLIAQYSLEQRVQLLGRVTREELASLYQTASLVVSMSSYECYGLTLAEALAAGTRVLATDLPAHIEVVQGAGVRTDRFVGVDADARTIAIAISESLGDDVPASSSLVPGWDEVAAQTSEVYRALAER